MSVQLKSNGKRQNQKQVHPILVAVDLAPRHRQHGEATQYSRRRPGIGAKFPVVVLGTWEQPLWSGSTT
jgi:hypothetical protein